MQSYESFDWDAFISHASEDKESFVAPLVAELQKYTIKIWFDKFTLHVGSSLRESIDNGRANSRFGVVVLSHAFFAKNWPKKELNALFSRQVNGRDVILPVWHELTKDDILHYSPLLSDMVAANSSDGLIRVARALVQVIRPTALQFQTSRTDANSAGIRMRQQLKEKFPYLDCRVTIGAQAADLAQTSPESTDPDVLTSSVYEDTRVEVFATDKEAYNREPLSFSVRLTEDGWRKIQEALQVGKRVELGPEEIVEFSSELFQFMSPSSDFAASKLIVGPTPGTPRRYRCKLTFALREDSEEFPYIEFETLQAGGGHLVLRSLVSPTPLQLTLTFNFVGGPSSFNAAYSYIGHEIRKVNKVHRALQFLLEGGTLQIVDLESDQVWPLVCGERDALPGSDRDTCLDEFTSALYEVAVALNEKIMWPSNRTTADHLNVQRLEKVVRTGQVSIPANEITMTIVPSPDVNIEESLQQYPMLYIRPNEAPDFATIFGKQLDLGPYSVMIQPQNMEFLAPERDELGRVIRIKLAQAPTYSFDRFLKARLLNQDRFPGRMNFYRGRA